MSLTKKKRISIFLNFRVLPTTLCFSSHRYWAQGMFVELWCITLSFASDKQSIQAAWTIFHEGPFACTFSVRVFFFFFFFFFSNAVVLYLRLQRHTASPLSALITNALLFDALCTMEHLPLRVPMRSAKPVYFWRRVTQPVWRGDEATCWASVCQTYSWPSPPPQAKKWSPLLSRQSIQMFQICWQGIPQTSFRIAGADPGFWSGGPSGVLTPRRGP